MISLPRRSAFTLVELLVVTGLMAVFFGLLVTGLRPNEDSDVRAATQNIVSSVLQAQTLGLQNPSGAGLLLNTADIPLASGSASISTGLSFASPQPTILVTATALTVGNSTRVTEINSLPNAASLSGTQAPVSFQPPDNADGVGDGYRIRFANSFAGTTPSASFGPWFRFEPAPDGSLAGIVSFVPEDGQLSTNTIWPVALFPLRLRCEIARRPEAVATATSFAKSVAIDMRYSGIGDDPYSAWGASPGSIAVQFSTTGAISSVIPVGLSGKPLASTAAAINKPTAPIYFLVTPRSLIDVNGSDLRSDKTVWVAVSPITGRVITGKNTPQSGPPPTLASSGNAKEAFIVAYRSYFQSARQQVRSFTEVPK